MSEEFASVCCLLFLCALRISDTDQKPGETERFRVIPLAKAHHSLLQEKQHMLGSLQRHPRFVL